MTWLWLGIPAGIAVSIWLYNFIEGKTLVHDTLDEVRLSRASLRDLDRAWAANENRTNAVFSLTTIPSRLPYLEDTLKSLLRQTLAPREIRLNIPKYSKREQCAYEVPDFLRELSALKIVDCDDYGPATKFIPSILQLPPDQQIVVVDDDRNYPPNLLADLVAASEANPEAAFSFCGWIVPPDLVHRPANLYTVVFIRPPAPVLARRIRRQRQVDIVRGVGGYLVKPRFLDADVLVDYSGAPEAAFFQDDIWLGAHLRVPRFVVPARYSNYQPRRRKRFYDRTSLGWINRRGEDAASTNHSVVTKHFADRWMVARKGRPKLKIEADPRSDG
jgi:hypothetical protein